MGTIEQLVSEPIATAIERSKRAFEEQVAPYNGIVLFGAGRLGRRTLAGLRRLGKAPPLAFSDNNQKLWGTTIEGVPVLPPAEAAERYGREAAFIITIWGGLSTHRMEHSFTQLRGLGCQRVTDFGRLYWKHPETFLPHYCVDVPQKVIAEREDVCRAFALLEDDASRRLFLDHVLFRLRLDWLSMPPACKEKEYFVRDLYSWRKDEVYVDVGGFDGDTIQRFLDRGLDFRRIIALEPDPANFVRMKSRWSSFPVTVNRRIELVNAAASDRRQTLRFQANADSDSKVGSGDLEVQGVALDDALVDRPTLIKIDVEGAEMDALRGARKTIAENRPVLTVCLYHVQNHLWQVPLFIRGLSDQYHFRLRAHGEQGWDLVLYAVPSERMQ
jgi:FkbM family methyltransferase